MKVIPDVTDEGYSRHATYVTDEGYSRHATYVTDEGYSRHATYVTDEGYSRHATYVTDEGYSRHATYALNLTFTCSYIMHKIFIDFGNNAAHLVIWEGWYFIHM